KLLLKAGVMEDEEIKKDDKGTPQGGVISPLLANIYLNNIDKGWKPLTPIFTEHIFVIITPPLFTSFLTSYFPIPKILSS
ncbi:MAG: hypothetical protein ABH952_12180, partial [Candidatus Omnitrophota bacterium]